MRYVQLRAFHYVAVHGGFSKAAAALFLTQPAISDQVRKLEEEYDVKLFFRHKRQVTMTDTGRQLLDFTRRMFDTENQALEFLSEARALRAGSLRIVADSALHLLHLLPQFRAQYPGIELAIHSGNTQDVLRKLDNYEADIGVLGELIERPDLVSIRLGTDPLVAFVAHTHPWGRRRSVKLADLCQQPLVLRERGSRTRQKLEEEARMRDLPLTIAIEAEGREAVREIVASGTGVGVVSRAEFGHDTRLVAIKISDSDMCMEEALVCLSERSDGKLISAFLDLARGSAA